MTSQLISCLPPSPIDLSSPHSRKETSLHINTKQNPHDNPNSNNNVFWKESANLFSPPLSPLTPHNQDRPLSSSSNRKKQGSMSWQQWDHVDIEKLTLENAKLKRSNRLLKVDREDWLEKRIRPLDQHIRDLTAANVRWQRAAKLLQQDLLDSQQQMEEWKHKQVIQMPQMGCEYQFLVDMIYQLQTQINGQTLSKEINGSARISTPNDVAPSKATRSNGQQHRSPMTTMTDEKGWKEFSVLLDRIQELETNLDATLRQLEEKQQNEDRFKCELLTKDQVIRLMEKDYDGLTTQIQTLQHMVNQGEAQQLDPTPLANEAAFTPTGQLKRNKSSMTADSTPNDSDDYGSDGSSDRGFCDDLDGASIFDGTRAVDRVLPDGNNTKGSDGCQENAATFDKLPCDQPPVDHRRTLSSGHSSTSTAITDAPEKRWTASSSTTSDCLAPSPNWDPPALPGTYTSQAPIPGVHDDAEEGARMISSLIMGHEPFAPFVVLTFLLGIFTKMGIKDDWLVPLTLLALCSGYLWRGEFCGIHIKVNF